MKRREFLQISGGLSARVIVGGSLLSIRKTFASMSSSRCYLHAGFWRRSLL
jgi:hypothetical protein